MAYRTVAEAKKLIKDESRRIRTGQNNCYCVRDAYGNPRGFLHRGKAVAYEPKRGKIAPSILDMLINGVYEKTSVGAKLRLIKLVRYERENGTVKGYEGF